MRRAIALAALAGCDGSVSGAADAGGPSLSDPVPLDIVGVRPAAGWEESGTALGTIVTNLVYETYERLSGRVPSIRVGVTTANLGDGPWEAGCSDAGTGGRFVKSCSTTGPGYTDEPSCDAYATFESEDDVAVPSCSPPDTWCDGFSQPLQAVRAALDTCDAFLRNESLLVIVILGGADDCSAGDWSMWDPDLDDAPPTCDPVTRCALRTGRQVPVSDYVDFLASLRPPERIAVLVIAPGGDVETTSEDCAERDDACAACAACECLPLLCNNTVFPGAAAPRLADFVRRLGDAGALARFEPSCGAMIEETVLEEFAEDVLDLADK